MSRFHLFVYGTLRRGGAADHMMSACEYVGHATVPGLLYDIDGAHPALLLYGDARVSGDVWSCPADLLQRLDEYEGTQSGLFRRVAVEAEADGGDVLACWAYAAGPALAPRLTASNRIDGGVWRPSNVG